ncbi:hypothetical protein J6590_089960 [Homalodisca vitripennis]|nr:hypothetical protein J6590_089960 [Homalodisca vitripennis]
MASILFYVLITLLLVSCGIQATERPPFFAIIASPQDMDDSKVFPDGTEHGRSDDSQNLPTSSTTPDPNKFLFIAPKIRCRKCYRVVNGECRRIVGCRLRDP